MRPGKVLSSGTRVRGKAWTPFARHVIDWTGGNGYWAEDPGWANPGDGGNVTSWPDMVGTLDLPAYSTNYPTFDADGVGGKPAVYSSAAGYTSLRTTSGTASQPGTIFGVFLNDGGNGNANLWSGANGSARWMVDFNSSSIRLYAGAVVNGGAGYAGGGPYLVVGQYDTTSSILRVNGTNIATGNAATYSLSGLTLFANYTGFNDLFKGWCPVFGRYPGKLLDHSNLLLWEYMLAQHYGITLGWQ